MVADVARADHQIGTAGHDRLGQLADVARVVLVVAVGIHDHVGTHAQRRIETAGERHGEPLVLRQTDDCVGAVVPSHRDRVIGGAVVDDQPQHLAEAVHMARKCAQGCSQCLCLVEARDLDDQPHPPIVSGRPGTRELSVRRIRGGGDRFLALDQSTLRRARRTVARTRLTAETLASTTTAVTSP